MAGDCAHIAIDLGKGRRKRQSSARFPRASSPDVVSRDAQIEVGLAGTGIVEGTWLSAEIVSSYWRFIKVRAAQA